MHDIQPFIDEGWYTIPLGGKKITRDENGTKIGFKFPPNWTTIYREDFNEQPTPLGAVFTGVESGIVAIDCDTQLAYELIHSLDPEYKSVMVSRGKLDKNKQPIPAATYIYKWEETLPPTMHKGPFGIEFFNEGGSVFLPTDNNESKIPWDEIPEIKPMPNITRELLLSLVKPPNRKEPQSLSGKLSSKISTVGMRLAPLVEQALKQSTNSHGLRYYPGLFKIITPYSYRNAKYKKQGHLHPNDIEGSGSQYLAAVSAILGADISIDKELYKTAIEYVNSLWEDPMPKKRLEQTIIKPMITEQATIEGTNTPFWQYDPNWEELSLMITNRRGQLVEYFYDDAKHIIYEINHDNMGVTTLDIGKYVRHITLSSIEKFTNKTLEARIPNYNTFMAPHLPFGLGDNYRYNIFKATRALQIIHNPEMHREKYEEPSLFIEFIESLIPNRSDRTYLLRHLVTKLRTFQHSPTIYYMVGVPGSGKGLFTKTIEAIIGAKYCSLELGGPQLMESTGFNGWLLDKYFVGFNEIGKELHPKDADAAMEKIKRYTGSEQFQLRIMRENTSTAQMLATFILSANSGTFQIDPDDRRIHYVDTPNKWKRGAEYSDFVQHHIDDISYYLTITYESLSTEEYNEPPFSETKRRAMINKQPVGMRILSYVLHEQYDDLYELAIDSGISLVIFEEWKDKGRIKTSTLASIIDSLSHMEYDAAFRFLKSESKKVLPWQPRRPYSNNEHYIQCKNFEEFIPPIDTSELDDAHITGLGG